MVNPEYYFISDLHIGGEGNLMPCDFEAELIEFLQLLEGKTNSTELIIVGDAFSFWEMTRTSPTEKNEAIPYWFFSNYFYKEMSIWLRWILLPFLLLLSISILLLVSAVLEQVGIVPSGFFSKPWLDFLQNFGFAGNALYFTVNLVLFIDTVFLFG